MARHLWCTPVFHVIENITGYTANVLTATRGSLFTPVAIHARRIPILMSRFHCWARCCELICFDSVRFDLICFDCYDLLWVAYFDLSLLLWFVLVDLIWFARFDLM